MLFLGAIKLVKVRVSSLLIMLMTMVLIVFSKSFFLTNQLLQLVVLGAGNSAVGTISPLSMLMGYCKNIFVSVSFSIYLPVSKTLSIS